MATRSSRLLAAISGAVSHHRLAVLPSGRFPGRCWPASWDRSLAASGFWRWPRHRRGHGPDRPPARPAPCALLGGAEHRVRGPFERCFAADEPFRKVAARLCVLHRGVEEVEQLDGCSGYDLVISGLPLNNFAVADVEQILAVMKRLLRPGGTLSFFEYIAIRKAKTIVSSPAERERLRGISRALDAPLGPHEFQCDWIWPNLPPAWVHHVSPAG